MQSRVFIKWSGGFAPFGQLWKISSKYSVISLFISGLDTSFWQRFQVFLFPTLPCMGWNLIFKPSSAFSVIIKEMCEFFAMFTFDIIVNKTKSFLYWCVNVRYWFSLTTFNSIIFSKSHNASQNIPVTFSSITNNWFMCGVCHIRSVLIGIEYRNWCPTFDIYLLFAILLGQIYRKTKLQICNLHTGQSIRWKYVNQFSLNLLHPNSKK